MVLRISSCSWLFFYFTDDKSQVFKLLASMYDSLKFNHGLEVFKVEVDINFVSDMNIG